MLLRQYSLLGLLKKPNPLHRACGKALWSCFACGGVPGLLGREQGAQSLDQELKELEEAMSHWPAPSTLLTTPSGLPPPDPDLDPQGSQTPCRDNIGCGPNCSHSERVVRLHSTEGD